MSKELLNIGNKNNTSGKYFYCINYPVFEENLCKMEMECLFNQIPSEKKIFSDHYVNPSISPFIKDMISITYEEDSLKQIVERIKQGSIRINDRILFFFSQ